MTIGPLADVNAVDKREPLSKVLGWMRGETDRRPVIMDGRSPYAIVNARLLMGRGIHDRTGLHKVAQPVPVLNEDDDLYLATEAFADSLVPYLPIADGRGRLAGCLPAETCLADLAAGPLVKGAALSELHVRDTDHVDDAMHTFAKALESQLPVLRR